MRPLLLVLFLIVAAAPARPAPPGQNDAPRPRAAQPDEVLLTDGNILRGLILEEHETHIVFTSESLGRLEIPRAMIVRIAGHGDRAGVMSDPDYNSIMFCPTPATLAKGDSYFRDFELFFLNFGTSLSDAFDLSIGTLFPLSADVIMVSVGGKLRLVDREDQGLGLALVGSYTHLEEVSFSALGAVAGIGNRRNSLNLMVNRTSDDDGDTETVYIIGGDAQMTRRSKFFAEYMSSSTLFLDDSDIEGFVNIGVRLFGDTHSFSLSGFRPLDEDTDSFIAFPMIMYSNHF